MEYKTDWDKMPFGYPINIGYEKYKFICIQDDLIILFDIKTKEIINLKEPDFKIDQEKTYENNHPWIKLKKYFKKKK